MAVGPLALTPDIVALQRAVAGRYALERELGRGGMGLVLLARDVGLDRPVAIKLLPGALAGEAGLRARFLREARISAGLSHPHIVPIYAVEEHPEVVFFAMAYVDGETLAERLRRTGPLPVGEVARVLREVAWALAYAHGRGVVHRDVKPDNVMIERGSGRALVSDFGIAQSAAAPSTLTRDGEILGTVAFMSPEQAAGEALDGRSDLYALGGVGFYALTARPPFEAPSAAALLVRRLTLAAPPVASMRADVPPRLSAVVDRCLARLPGDRFASAEATAEALAEATGAPNLGDIAPPVRSFTRAAEQTLWLVWLVVVFTALYGLPTTRRLDFVLAGIAFGVAVVSVDLVRRARELLAEGFGAADVRRAFALERQAHDAELRVLFDARRTAVRRSTRRRAWATVAGTACLKVAEIAVFPRWMPGMSPRPGYVVASVLTDLTLAAGFVLALNTSPRAERRFFRLSARVWGSRVGPIFFWIAGLGRGRRAGMAGASGGAGPESAVLTDAVAPAVMARFPALPAVVRQLAEAHATLSAREADIARAVAAAGFVVGSAATDGATHATAALTTRRDALLIDMRDALEATRTRRTATAAARENLRVQLLRIGAGIGTPDDLVAELDAAHAVLADATAS